MDVGIGRRCMHVPSDDDDATAKTDSGSGF